MAASGFFGILDRAFRRLFAGADRPAGFARGDESLFELLDLNLLRLEARETDIAVGRIGACDRGRLCLDQAAVWRELARRTGDPAALRKAASAAEEAWNRFASEKRFRAGAEARRRQARIAMIGAEMFGEATLDTAAGFILSHMGPLGSDADAARTKGALALLAARRDPIHAGLAEALHASTAFDPAVQTLERSCPAEAASLRCDRAEMLAGFGARLGEPLLFSMAVVDLRAAGHGIDPAYQPLSWLRVQELTGTALAGLGQASGDLSQVLEAVNVLTSAADQLTPDHSPVDWARVRYALGRALLALADATDDPAPLQQARTCFTLAAEALDEAPSLVLRAMCADSGAVCRVRHAELCGSRAALDEAEAGFRDELVRLNRRFDPVAWAVLQLNLARVYLARAAAGGHTARSWRDRAAEALAGALEVFGDHRLDMLADAASQELARAAARPPSRALR